MSDDLSIPNPDYRGNRAGRYGHGRGRQGMDPDTRRLVMFAGGLGAILVVLIGASALVGRHSEGIPVVTADTRPIRVKPENPGGMKIDGAENDVFSGGTDTADAKLAPPSETPDTKALRTAANASPPPVIAPPAPVIAPAAPAIAPPAQEAVTPPPAVKPTVAATAPVAAKTIPVTTAKVPAPAAVEAHAAASGHPAIVQLAALASEDAARNEWQLLSKRMPDLMHGHQPAFSRTEHDGRTFWRLRTSGFADVSQARAFCDHVRQKGAGCSVADF